MLDQNFGTKELYEVVLRANTPMQFGQRMIEKGEIVLAFDKISVALLNEQSHFITARGGWGNMPRVIWEDRSEVTFKLTQGVLSSLGFGILTSAKMLYSPRFDNLFLSKKELFDFVGADGVLETTYTPTAKRPIFCYEYERDTIQRKVDCELQDGKIVLKNVDLTKSYLADYYFEYGDEALMYLIEKERFTGTFTLEGKFYTKDENDGINVTNILTMPKVRVASEINLRLGERADPTISVFSVIAIPERTLNSNTELFNIVRLGKDIDGV